ncbi:helix-turn-helix domain-containing protein [Ectothiorhodospira variabilis]|uniref:helix-turn-helix domain-containing protein n=1 Tax=Ectothiorhodospira variabilis TaxID=505694 RepID=UPI001EFBE515|nr:helix-turn-helix transcriptional regulator [Ectothiorhodospira variabilis]MCG5494669.1 helix-turn-helix transcriptional regulator [Ectothiorhodospira variabilis]MCG5499073.1 helix-turn-helix transcriptional regulator [Ectothiorhodospira variabilis]MCG5505109.1 helix-turn-helix transcriptional regulator [Ectothiorhodospira variabilis]MCG5508266.1 helix-turn-helix transcriptional regulator [Ectothiorhodospira variabilis]
MLTHEQLKAKALENREVREEYERVNREEFALLDMLLQARREAGLTQAEVAARMGTKAPAIARLERSLASGQHSPSISTVRRYLKACGKHLQLEVI